jgi:hypothetical protein
MAAVARVAEPLDEGGRVVGGVVDAHRPAEAEAHGGDAEVVVEHREVAAATHVAHRRQAVRHARPRAPHLVHGRRGARLRHDRGHVAQQGRDASAPNVVPNADMSWFT